MMPSLATLDFFTHNSLCRVVEVVVKVLCVFCDFSCLPN